MDAVCALCGGMGMKIVERTDGSRAARDCDCRLAQRRARSFERAAIPRLYKECTLENLLVDPHDEDISLAKAKVQARKFINSYPLETRGTGLLITGNVGSGKTHLAVAVLRALIENRSAVGLFCHYHDLIKQVMNSYNPHTNLTELQVLEPIMRVEVLVLDELGVTKPSDWVTDTISHILNTRYNERRTTILTTNYANATGVIGANSNLTSLEQSRQAMRRETLGDRIGERTLSRLQEMCVIIKTTGPDYRSTHKAARFG